MSAPVRTSIGFGLRISTPIDLPGAIRTGQAAPADIEIEFGVTPRWAERVAWGPYRVADADLFEFAMPGLARFTCTGRRRVTIDPEKGADRAAIAVMLIATVIPALFWARGEIVLHAAAWAPPGGGSGIALAGVSGIGKSTQAARAMGRGAYLIGDDTIRLRAVGGAVLASGLPGGLFVRRPAEDGERDFVPSPPGRQWVEHRLGALLVLDPAVARPSRVSGPRALAALLRHRHRPRIAALLGTEPAFLDSLAHIAGSLKIVSCRPPHAFVSARQIGHADANGDERDDGDVAAA